MKKKNIGWNETLRGKTSTNPHDISRSIYKHLFVLEISEASDMRGRPIALAE